MSMLARARPAGMSRRPLTASSADQALFVDRDAETETIRSAIGLGLNTFVAGPPGSGKTSLLRHLQRLLEDAGDAVVFVNVEPAGVSVTDVIVSIARAIDPDGPGTGSPSTIAEDETDLVVVE